MTAATPASSTRLCPTEPRVFWTAHLGVSRAPLSPACLKPVLICPRHVRSLPGVSETADRAGCTQRGRRVILDPLPLTGARRGPGRSAERNLLRASEPAAKLPAAAELAHAPPARLPPPSGVNEGHFYEPAWKRNFNQLVPVEACPNSLPSAWSTANRSVSYRRYYYEAGM